jgi:hypothetical protein
MGSALRTYDSMSLSVSEPEESEESAIVRCSIGWDRGIEGNEHQDLRDCAQFIAPIDASKSRRLEDRHRVNHHEVSAPCSSK